MVLKPSAQARNLPFTPHRLMLLIPKILRVCAVLLVAGALTGCDIETTPSDHEDSGVNNDKDGDNGEDAEEPVDRMFVEESYGIGMNWFNYAKKSHALLPIERVYRFERGEDTILFQLESYYNEHGDSGHFSIKRQLIGASNEQAELIAMTSNVKDQPVCVNLKDAVETNCAEDGHDLVIRTDFREIAPAGFALSTPGFYVASHFTDETGIKLSYALLASLEAGADAIDDASAWKRYKEANSNLSDAVLYSKFHGLEVGESTPAILHASPQMKMIGWAMEKTAERAFDVSVNCVKLRMKKSQQDLPVSADFESWPLEFAPASITLVSLCDEDGPKIVEETSTPYRAMWPETDTFDLIIDTMGDSTQVRFPPGHLLMSTGSDTIDENTDIPVSFWDNDDIG